ncbi:MAG: hypothetical protein RL434_285 [Pseudomonadota bacterium]|jgi:predicted Zn-dependent protease
MPGLMFGLMLASVLAVTGCATNPVTGESDFVMMSETDELAAGREAHQQILKQYELYADQALQAYVTSVGQRVAAKGHRPDLRYTFTVLDSPEINAFALPGGYVYITRGLMAYLNSEAELAGVLGHEVGHITARHGVRQQSASQATGLGVGLLSIFVPQMGALGRQAANLLGTALVRGYGRDQELEADRLGAEYLARAGYDPEAIISLLTVLKDQEILDQQLAQLEGREVRAYHGVFSTHPRNDTRLAEVVGVAQQLATTPGERHPERYLDALEGLVFGLNPAGGIVRGQRFLHPQLDFVVEFPAGWRIVNETSRVIAGDSGGFAQLQLALLPAADLPSPEAVLQKLGVRELISGTPFTADGSPGLMGFTRMTVQGAQRVVRLAIILRASEAYVFLGMTAQETDMPYRDPDFLRAVKSFRHLSAEERTGTAPRRVRVITATGKVSWQSLAETSPLKRLPEAQLRTLNAAPAGSSIVPGTRLKIVD